MYIVSGPILQIFEMVTLRIDQGVLVSFNMFQLAVSISPGYFQLLVFSSV